MQIALDTGGKTSRSSHRTIGRRLLELGLIDEIDLHILPVLLGDGIRLYDNPGGAPITLHHVDHGGAHRGRQRAVPPHHS